MFMILWWPLLVQWEDFDDWVINLISLDCCSKKNPIPWFLPDNIMTSTRQILHSLICKSNSKKKEEIKLKNPFSSRSLIVKCLDYKKIFSFIGTNFQLTNKMKYLYRTYYLNPCHIIKKIYSSYFNVFIKPIMLTAISC